jgi:hypothetical protein
MAIYMLMFKLGHKLSPFFVFENICEFVDTFVLQLFNLRF